MSNKIDKYFELGGGREETKETDNWINLHYDSHSMEATLLSETKMRWNGNKHKVK